jgi:hypothetical protein
VLACLNNGTFSSKAATRQKERWAKPVVTDRVRLKVELLQPRDWNLQEKREVYVYLLKLKVQSSKSDERPLV